MRGGGSKERAPPGARPGTLRALLRNMYKKKLAFLYTNMYYHTNAIKNILKKWIHSIFYP